MNDTPCASWTLQEAVSDYVKTHRLCPAALGAPPRLFDVVPSNAAVPYAVIGDDDETNASAEEVPASAHTFTIGVYDGATGTGFKNVKQIAQTIREILDGATFDIEGFSALDLTWKSTSHRRHPDDGAMRMSLLAFGVELRPTT